MAAKAIPIAPATSAKKCLVNGSGVEVHAGRDHRTQAESRAARGRITGRLAVPARARDVEVAPFGVADEVLQEHATHDGAGFDVRLGDVLEVRGLALRFFFELRPER